MKMQDYLQKAMITMICAGGLLLAAGCSSYGHHGPEHRDKGDRVERPAASADHAPMRVRERQGRPEMGKAGVEGRRERGAMAMRGPGAGMGMRGEGPGIATRMLLAPEAVKDLGLSDDQVKQIRAIAERNKDQRRDIGERQRAGQEKMRELMEGASPDKQAIMSQIEENGRAMTEMQKLQTSEMLDVRSVLTPEQIKKARELRRDRAAGMGGRGMGPGMGMGRGPMGRPQGGGEGRPGGEQPQTF